MTVSEAKERTTEWVTQEGRKMPGYAGALFAGSINRKSSDETLPAGSDVDVFIVLDQDDTSSTETKKFHHHGLVLETAGYPAKMFQNPEIAIADFRVACHLAAQSIISDPTGMLASAHEFALREYPRRMWIRKRCEGLFEWIELFADNPPDASPLLSLWVQWVWFPVTGGQAVAVADLLDPTVKRSLVVSRDILARYGELPMQDLLLEVGGFRNISVQEVERYVEEYLQILDAAIECRRPEPFPGSNWVSAEARELIRAGVTDMIRSGCHREVMAYLIQVSIVALAVIDSEASESVKQKAVEAYWHFMSYLGIKNEDDHRARIARMREALSELKATTERIIQANPNAID